MDHRTIVSFFTCQLVWVNRYPVVTRQYQDEMEALNKRLSTLKAK